MKKWIFISSFVFLTSNLFCQDLKWEIINAGIAFGFSKDKNGYYNPDGGALTFGAALRYNLKEKPLALGVDYTFSGWNKYSSSNLPDYHQFAHVFLLTTDYNYTNISPKFIPFGGLGIGYALIEESELWVLSKSIYTYDKSHFAISPRIGFEVFKKLRFTAEYKYLGNGNNFFNYKLGFIVGF